MSAPPTACTRCGGFHDSMACAVEWAVMDAAARFAMPSGGGDDITTEEVIVYLTGQGHETQASAAAALVFMRANAR